MGRSLFDQETQIRKSGTFSDTLAAGVTLESGSASLEGDLNSLRSQLKRILDQDVAGHWYQDLPTTNGKKRDITDLNADLDDIEEKRVLFRAQKVEDIVVSAAQNWEILSVASSETPAETAAVGAVSTVGAVVASIAGSFGAHALTEVAGPTTTQPKNLVLVRDGGTGDPIMSSGRVVYGLIQCEFATDGHTFNDVDHRVQISFVRENAAHDDLEACPVGDIENKTINYSYVRRINFDAIPEWAFLTGAFLDEAAATVVTRQLGYDNQGTTPVDLTTNAILDMETAGIYWEIRDAAEASLFKILEGSTGGTSEIEVGGDVDIVDINAAAMTIASGVTIDDGAGGVDIEIGVTNGQINTTSTDNLALKAGGELFFDDGNRTGSTFSSAMKFSEDNTEWSNFEAEFGEVSLLKAITMAAERVERAKVAAEVTADIAADVNVTGAGVTPNLSAQLPSYAGLTFVTACDIFVNGALQRNGANAAANNDVYPGDTAANGDLKFEFGLKYRGGTNPDVITMIVWGEPTS